MDSKRDREFCNFYDELRGKLSHAVSVKENQTLYLERLFQELKQVNSQKVQKTLFNLNSNAEKLLELYATNTKSSKAKTVFFHQQPKEDFISEEERFTLALTAYTRKQFFEGIGDLAGAQDKSRYQLLDLNDPENLLIRGETKKVKQQDKQEIQRLQSQYVQSEENRINSEVSCVQMQKAVEVSERQLQHLSNGAFYGTSETQIREDLMKASTQLKESKECLLQLYRTEILPLLGELQDLQSTKVLQGNYDLKIARQDYFLSKQNEVIKQLLQQFSRNYLITMLYELGYKEHRDSYHLLISAKTLLDKEMEKIKKRLNSLSDPIMSPLHSTKETISSKDELVSKFHDIIVPQTGENETLYKTYSNMLNAISVFSSNCDKVQQESERISTEKTKNLKELDEMLASTEKLLHPHSHTHEELSTVIHELEENLSIAELQVNDVIKDIVMKRKTLSSDSLKVLERSIFPNFFNDPARMKRMINELQLRVNASVSSGK